MKIRLALNSDFVTRKIRGAVYGILLLLTFFVPQFAKTQDQLNAAKSVQALGTTAVAFEQKLVSSSSVKSEEAYVAVVPIPDRVPAEAQAFRFEAEETPATTDPVPLETASLMNSAIPLATFTPVEVRKQSDVAALSAPTAQLAAASPTRKPVRYSEPRTTIAKQSAESAPVQIASLSLSTIPLAAQTPSHKLPIKSSTQMVEPAVTESILVASLTPTILPAAQSVSGQSTSFTGQALTMDIVNVPLVDFFRAMAQEGGINIVLDPAIQGNVTLSVVKMPWDQLFNVVLRSHGLDKSIEQGNVIRVTLKKTLQEEARQEEELKKANMMAADLETRVKRLNYAKASDLKTLLSDQKSERGAIVVDERTNSLVIIDLPDSIDKQFKLIESLDISQPQVEIETRIVSATRNYARDLGVQFGFVQGNNQRVTVGGANPNYLQPGPASRPSGDTGTSSNSPGVSAGTSDTGGNLNVNLPARSPFGGIGIAVGNILDTFMLDAAITAGESKGWAKLISQPKVTVQNNSPALINNGVRFPVQVVSDNTITIQYYDAALSLTVTPQITYEGNILLDLEATNNKADFGYTSTGGVPTIRTSETSSRILVSDGGTTMFGGIIVEDEGTNEDRIPGLGSLPVLGNLFRRTATVRDTQEIMFFVTPRVVR